MDTPLPRREFVRRALIAGAGIVVSPSLGKVFQSLASPSQNPPATYELCAAVGDKFFDNTLKAVDALGGMTRFVKKGGTVGILVNSPFDGKGTSVNPDIALAVVKMSLDAGAGQVFTINSIGQRYWRQSGRFESLKTEVGRLQHSGDYTEVQIEQGKKLRSAEISRTLLTCDTFINVPIIKDHEGTRYTCNMKNMMGACSSSTCRKFHFGDSSILNMLKGYYSNVELLSQSIADVNLVRRPTLTVVDATEILVTNGPSGPGDLRWPKEVIASTDCVAADMYAVHHLGLDWQEMLPIRYALEHGYGPKSLKEVSIRTI